MAWEYSYAYRRAYLIMAKYGITPDEFTLQMERQGWRCAICRKLFVMDKEKYNGPEYPHVDHDHLTGEVRGILCSSCNQGIGKLQDDVEILKRAAKYLENPPWAVEIEDSQVSLFQPS
jgi:hypothetical protein